jgi:hypothetical protein
MFRASFEWVSLPIVYCGGGYWRVRKCWKVDPRWVSRAVDLDRRGPTVLRLLTPTELVAGDEIYPHRVLECYLATLPPAVKLQRTLERRAAA